MKKIIISLILPLALAGCGGSETTNQPLVEYSNHIISQYPNFGSNEIARKTITDSIYAHAQSLVGTTPKDFNGVDFKFEKLVEIEGKHGALFHATLTSDIDSPTPSRKYIITNLYISAFTEVDEQTASSLDATQIYSIAGEVVDWEAKDYAALSAPYENDALDFGTFFLRNATIKPAKP